MAVQIKKKSAADELYIMGLGGCSAIISGFAVHPIDTIKIQMQLQHQLYGFKKYQNIVHGIYTIAKEEGFRRGTCKGLGASLMREGMYSSIRIGAYEPVKVRLLGETDPKTTPVWKRFLAGAIAGGVGQSVAQPIDYIKTKAQGSPAGKWRPVSTHAKEIYQLDGIKGFYKGYSASVLRATFLGAAYMGSYDTTKQFILRNKYLEDGLACQFTASIIAGFCMTCATSPFDNIKTRLMNQVPGVREYSGLTDCAMKMWHTEGGAIAFCRGFGGNWARFAPLTTIQLLVWEQLRKLSGMGSL